MHFARHRLIAPTPTGSATGCTKPRQTPARVAAAASPVTAAMSRVALVSALLERGDVYAADAAFGEIGIGEHVTQFRPFVGLLLIRMELRAARGRHTAAVADFTEATRRIGEVRGGALLEDWLVAIERTHAIGDHDAARAQLDDALEVAHRWGTDNTIGTVLRVRGRLTVCRWKGCRSPSPGLRGRPARRQGWT